MLASFFVAVTKDLMKQLKRSEYLFQSPKEFTPWSLSYTHKMGGCKRGNCFFLMADKKQSEEEGGGQL